MSAATIFGVKSDVTTYGVTLRVRHLMVGGVPSSPSVIAGWLRTRMDENDKALAELKARTLRERFGGDVQPSTDELVEAMMDDPEGPSVNGFKRDGAGQLVYEGRCMKAAIKEFANSAYPGTEWPGKKDVSKGFRKGLMSTLAERAFVDEEFIGLGVSAPTRVEERIKHVMTPMGPKSAINKVEVVEAPTLTFTLRVHDDFLPQEAWGRIWERGEDIGVGADRGRSDGKFELMAFDRA